MKITTKNKLSANHEFLFTEPLYDSLQQSYCIELLKQTIIRCLEKANELKLRTLSLAAETPESKRWPLPLSLEVKITSVKEYLRHSAYVEVVRLVSENNIIIQQVNNVIVSMQWSKLWIFLLKFYCVTVEVEVLC